MFVRRGLKGVQTDVGEVTSREKEKKKDRKVSLDKIQKNMLVLLWLVRPLHEYRQDVIFGEEKRLLNDMKNIPN